jgi:hypothetical protein
MRAMLSHMHGSGVLLHKCLWWLCGSISGKAGTTPPYRILQWQGGGGGGAGRGRRQGPRAIVRDVTMWWVWYAVVSLDKIGVGVW